MEGFDDDFSPLQSGAAAKDESSSDLTGTSPVAPESARAATAASPSPVRFVQEPREEPEVIKKWKEEQVKLLEEKDRNEEKAKIALKNQAKKELEDWYKQHSEQLVKLQKAHRAASESAEKEFRSTTLEIKPGTEWERVAKLCDFNPKSARNTKDISRMRSVILQLKQQSTGNAA